MEYPWWFGTETLFPAGAHRDRRLRSRQADPPPAAESVDEGQRQRPDRARGDDQRRRCPIPGNTQETAQFILTVGKLVEWTGDLDFAREMYPAMKLGLHWLLTDMDQNQESFPEGYGIMEVLRPQCGADRRRGVHPAGAGGHRAASPAFSASRTPRSATGGWRQQLADENQRALLGRGGRLVRRLLRHQGPGDQRGGGADQADRAQGDRQADPAETGS